MRINQNIAAFNAYRNLNTTQNHLGKSLEKLSSGFRINRAADDAAGLVKSENLRAEIRGTNQAVANAQDGISMVQTAEGALNEVHAILQRMRELAVSAANETSTGEAEQAEVTQLLAELDAIAERTQFAGNPLLDGSLRIQTDVAADLVGATVDNATGAADDEISTIDISALDIPEAYVGDWTLTLGGGGEDETFTFGPSAGLADIAAAIDANANYTAVLEAGTITVSTAEVADGNITVGFANAQQQAQTGAVFQVGANANDELAVSFSRMDALALNINAVDVVADPSTAIDRIQSAIETVSTNRADLGATQNRLEHTIANLQVASENLAASESRIRDTDMAAEMVNFTRSQILQQAGTAMLAQANQVPQSVLALLR